MRRRTRFALASVALLLSASPSIVRGQEGPGGPPPAGQVLPGPMRDALSLDEEQIKKLDAIQEEVNTKLKALLTPDQQKMLQERMQRRGEQGPGGFGGPGGGFGGPGGGPGGQGRGPGGFGGGDMGPELMARLMENDKNGDGKLSKDELPERMQRILERVDADKDGFASKEELSKMVASAAGMRGEGQRGEGQRGGERGEGPRGGGEGEGRRGGMGMFGNPTAFVDRLFELDADKDGKLSRDELSKFAETMGRPGEGRGGIRGEGRPFGEGRPNGEGRPGTGR